MEDKEIFEKWEQFKDLLKSTNREGIENVIKWLDETDFKFAPASTQYHSSEKGGLLKHSLNVYYHMYDLELEVFVGKLNKDVEVVDEVNHLVWMDKTDNFFDAEKYAGEGNIGHMLLNVDMYEQELFGPQKELVKR